MIKKKRETVKYKEVLPLALCIRSLPSLTKSEVVKIVPQGTIVEFDKNYDNPEWDHVVADPDIEGYVMKKHLAPATPDKLAEFGNGPIVRNTFESRCDATIDKENEDDNEEETK